MLLLFQTSVLALQMCATVPYFLHGSWGYKLGRQTHMEGTLLTEPSHQNLITAL